MLESKKKRHQETSRSRGIRRQDTEDKRTRRRKEHLTMRHDEDMTGVERRK